MLVTKACVCFKDNNNETQNELEKNQTTVLQFKQPVSEARILKNAKTNGDLKKDINFKMLNISNDIFETTTRRYKTDTKNNMSCMRSQRT